MMAFAIRKHPEAFSLDKSNKGTTSFKDEGHLAFIRKLPSVISGAYGCDACHIRAGSPQHNKKMTGKSQKPSDCWTLPMTREEHIAQHDVNELAFWCVHGIDPFQLATDLYQVSGDTEAATALILKARKSA